MVAVHGIDALAFQNRQHTVTGVNIFARDLASPIELCDQTLVLVNKAFATLALGGVDGFSDPLAATVVLIGSQQLFCLIDALGLAIAGVFDAHAACTLRAAVCARC